MLIASIFTFGTPAAADEAAPPLFAYAPAAVETPNEAAAAIGAATSGDVPVAALPGGAPEPAPVPATQSAELMQKRRGLKVNGLQRRCLAKAIYFEARGEPVRGQAAVAKVVVERAKQPGYPPTICGVVFENADRHNACQFSFACDGVSDDIKEPRAWARATRVANDVLAGRWPVGEVGGATHYHATYVSPYWAPKMQKLARIGQHVFYRG